MVMPRASSEPVLSGVRAHEDAYPPAAARGKGSLCPRLVEDVPTAHTATQLRGQAGRGPTAHQVCTHSLLHPKNAHRHACTHTPKPTWGKTGRESTAGLSGLWFGESF